jgi:DNA adenine methylase
LPHHLKKCLLICISLDIYADMQKQQIKSPHPYFGSKRRIVSDIWARLGDVENYIEPFAGSLSVLLGCPIISKIETANDYDCFIPNFWRAVQADANEVAKYADYPVLEADLHARHRWLISPAADEFRKQMSLNPNYYDAKIAGWWVWGMNASIGITFCKQRGLECKPFLSMIGQGITTPGVDVLSWFKILQERTKKVRVCCGSWERVCTPPCTYKNKSLSKNGMVGVFLDPPYLVENREDKLYRIETNIFNDVCVWAMENASHPKMRIAVCGYDGDYPFPSNWERFYWRTTGGFSSLAKDKERGKENSKKETIWFSPNCIIGKV